MRKRVLVLVAEGVEEIELVTPVDLLRRAGAEVVLASMEERLEVTGRSQLTLLTDILFPDLGSLAPFDLLFLPGGPAVPRLRQQGLAKEVAARFCAEGKWVTAICAAPLILLDAGLLDGRRFTAHFSTQGELPEALMHETVVEDGLLLTSRGAGTALELGLAQIRLLFGPEKRTEVAAAVMAP